ncbi:MFS transporter [Hyphobacterium sp. CCMP332]|uniref:MFS transporter n=1 Tax=Hyphobacterium sp. CCMP332 TaxID=2749086 RepID=UPI00164EF5E6|nr:MFS transporter [Hyphobacterium sp. CCMP332]QNL19017.1 MFS transporter [Hyphobacterium sp. CCMP332]
MTFVNAGVSAAVQVFFPVQLAELGAGLTFYTYAAFGLFFVVLVARFVPETKGLTLEALEESASR